MAPHLVPPDVPFTACAHNGTVMSRGMMVLILRNAVIQPESPSAHNGDMHHLHDVHYTIIPYPLMGRY